jgi:HupE / UreJ protein
MMKKITKTRFGLLATLLVLLLSPLALAHKSSDSYLNLTVEQNTITGRWDVALRDLDFAIGLDQNDDGQITWGELLAEQSKVEAYVLGKLQLGQAGQGCNTILQQYQVNTHSDGGYSSLAFEAKCPANITALDIQYQLLFDLDPTHRGLLNLSNNGNSQTAIFSSERASQRFEFGTAPAATTAPALTASTPIINAPVSWQSTFISFIREGILHIWAGIDHILFLLALLLPSVLERRAGRWVPVDNLRTTIFSIIKIVTAFTIAHSITLTLASLQIIMLPSRLIESVIAASVVLAALNNIVPVVNERRRWLVAGGFGLIHGFGFANVLADLGLPTNALVSSLLAFNIGVEIGQLAIVAVFVPLAFVLRNTVFYRRFTLALGSVVVALIAATWMAERIMDFKVLPI